MKRAPAFMHYPDRWLSHTLGLSLEAEGFFNRLLNWMWLHSPDYASIANNSMAWAMAGRCSVQDAERLMPEVNNPFQPLLKVESTDDGERLVCEGLRKIREQQERTSAARSKAGRKGRASQLSEQLPASCPDKSQAIARLNQTKAEGNAGKTKVLTYGDGVGDGVGVSSLNPLEFASDLYAAYGIPAPSSFGESAKALTARGVTAEEAEAVLRFVRYDQSGKRGKDAPALPQSPSKAMLGIGDLIERALVWRAARKPQTPKPAKAAAPEPEPEPTAEELAEIKAEAERVKANLGEGERMTTAKENAEMTTVGARAASVANANAATGGRESFDFYRGAFEETWRTGGTFDRAHQIGLLLGLRLAELRCLTAPTGLDAADRIGKLITEHEKDTP